LPGVELASRAATPGTLLKTLRLIAQLREANILFGELYVLSAFLGSALSAANCKQPTLAFQLPQFYHTLSIL